MTGAWIRSTVIPKAEGRAFELSPGQVLRVTAIEGKQVGDLTVLNLHDYRERFSAIFTPAMNGRSLRRADHLYSGPPFFNAMLDVEHDTHGVHWIGGRCNRLLYEALGAAGTGLASQASYSVPSPAAPLLGPARVEGTTAMLQWEPSAGGFVDGYQVTLTGAAPGGGNATATLFTTATAIATPLPIDDIVRSWSAQVVPTVNGAAVPAAAASTTWCCWSMPTARWPRCAKRTGTRAPPSACTSA